MELCTLQGRVLGFLYGGHDELKLYNVRVIGYIRDMNLFSRGRKTWILLIFYHACVYENMSIWHSWSRV